MKASLIRMQLRSSAIRVLAFAMFVIVLLPVAQAARITYRGSYSTRVESRVYSPVSLASNRYKIEYEQVVRHTPSVASVIGARLTYDAARVISPNYYNADYNKDNIPEFDVRELYLQYQKGIYRMRLGQQQVAWGEAFGFYYADIVNPKDLRELGIASLSESREPKPMLNIQLLDRLNSLQLIYVPYSKINRVPSVGSDYAGDLRTKFRLAPTTTFTEVADPARDGPQGNYGARGAFTLAGIDFSTFYYSYLDHNPYYQIKVLDLAQSQYELTKRHNRVQSFGLTTSSELWNTVFRSEVMYTRNRRYNTIENGVSTLRDYTELQIVAGMDLPKWGKWTLNFQASQNRLEQKIDPVLRPRIDSLASARILYDNNDGLTWETIYSYSLEDKGNLFQSKLICPLSSAMELETGFYLFSGSKESKFGNTKQGSRAFLGLKGYFNG